MADSGFYERPGAPLDEESFAGCKPVPKSSQQPAVFKIHSHDEEESDSVSVGQRAREKALEEQRSRETGASSS